MTSQDYSFDLLVIGNLGGGSGGLSCAFQTAKLGFKVAIADFSKPSPLGKTWKLGGTCVNVGCIPKKLFHYAALLGQQRNDAQAAGWDLDTTCKHNWNTMTSMIQSFIENLNSGYETQLKQQQIDYFNAYASFKDAHTLQLKFGDDRVQIVTAKYIVISVGLRPSYPEGLIKSQAPILSSDDIFVAQTPKSTLIVGESYIALETASFLSAFGFSVTVLVRSIFLRGFDQQMANKIGEILENKGIKFLKGFIPVDAKEKEVNGEKMIEVQYQRTDGRNEIQTKCFHTVIAATGRVPKIDDMNLKEIGVKINELNGKIIVSPSDETNIPGLFAIGDIANERPELSPPAKLVKNNNNIVLNLLKGREIVSRKTFQQKN